MSYVITASCVDRKDRSCMAACPVDCIDTTDGDRMVYIDAELCIDCGSCLVSCPVDAPKSRGSLDGGEEPFAAINDLWYEDPDAARAEVASHVGEAP
ncbi:MULTISPECIES: indolepyruvate ferredoxin oxidoreductase subunit alpha [unclassified Streptomyces]|uniref:indolepyruvate ferredoxin oxidoreductase subunit alpha n=1 Tax=unclassified Streptomyces TaxID=2593676 RepID=UPI0038273983